MFLAADELIELTRRRRNDAQVRMLRAMGIEHRIRADGSVAVLRTHVERLFDKPRISQRRDQNLEPNWSEM